MGPGKVFVTIVVFSRLHYLSPHLLEASSEPMLDV